MTMVSENKFMRRVAGYHDIRLDGMTDLLLRCRGASVMDIGCNRGLVGFEFANNGARLVHGCDIYQEGIAFARHLFADMRAVESRFEVADLTKGPSSLKPFADQKYDITLMLATYHKLKRVMSGAALSELMVAFARMTGRYFAWRGTSDKPSENELEIRQIDRDFGHLKMRRVHTSYLSEQLGVCAIWRHP